VTEATTG